MPLPSGRKAIPNGGVSGRDGRRLRGATRLAPVLVRIPTASSPGPGRGCDASRRRRPRWPAVSRVRRRADTSSHRALRRPARPTWSPTSRPTHRLQVPRGATTALCCCAPGLFPSRAWRCGGRTRAERPHRAAPAPGGRGVVGEAARPQDDVGPRGLEGRTLELCPPTRQQWITRASPRHRLIRRFRVPARRVRRRRSIANPYNDRDGLADPLRLLGAPQERNRARPRPRLPARFVEHGQTHQDPGRTEPTLACAVSDERVGPPGALWPGQAFERRDRSPGDPSNRRDAGDPRVTVHPDRAAPALALRAASVLQGATPQLVAQRVEQRDPVVDDDRIAVEDEIYASRERHQPRQWVREVRTPGEALLRAPRHA